MYYVFFEDEHWVLEDTQSPATEVAGAYLYENGIWLKRIVLDNPKPNQWPLSWRRISPDFVPSLLRLKLLLLQGASSPTTALHST